MASRRGQGQGQHAVAHNATCMRTRVQGAQTMGSSLLFENQNSIRQRAAIVTVCRHGSAVLA